MTTLTLDIEIEDSQVQELREEGFALFVGMIVNGVTNVVWKKLNNFVHENKITWLEDVYGIAGAHRPQLRQLVETETEINQIGLGQTIVINKDGNIDDAQGLIDKTSESFTLTNEKPGDAIAVAVYCGANLKELRDPIYISKPMQTGFTREFIPTPETVVVWFGEDTIQGGSVISKIMGPKIEVIFADAKEHKVSWSKVNGIPGWSVVSVPLKTR